MKITFIGLSCFMIENEAGFCVLVDPFNDSDNWALGPRFPLTYNNKPLGANIVLITEPDADHAYAPGDWLAKAPDTKINSSPFPNLDLRGTVVYEWNGDVNIAYHYNIDGLRLAHFGDHAHKLTPEQLNELQGIDIVFMPAPKALNQVGIDNVIADIKALNPKLVIWAHHLAPDNLPDLNDSLELQKYFRNYFAKNAHTNQAYKDDESFINLCYVLQNAVTLNTFYNGKFINESSIIVEPAQIKSGQKTETILFTKMLASSRNE